MPLVTVLIPARNEGGDLLGCLDAVAAQDYPGECVEVIVVDGSSSDDTRAVAERSLGSLRVSSTTVIDNPMGTTPSNLNIGLQRACGEVLCRVDARTRIQPDYLQTCVQALRDRPEISVVGGAQVAAPRDDTTKARGIARALNNRWTMGAARYRRRASSGPADTVYLGAFRTAQLRAAGGWDARFETNQDFDLNRRMSTFGVIWFHEALASSYLPRATHTALFKQYIRFGRWKVRYWRVAGDRPQRRQVALMLVPLVAGAPLLLIPKRLWPLAAGAGLLALDALGARLPSRSVGERLHAAVGIALITGGWTLGLWVGLVAPQHQTRPVDATWQRPVDLGPTER